MNADRFAATTRSLVAKCPRRTVPGLALGGVLGGHVLTGGGAGSKKRKKKKCKALRKRCGKRCVAIATDRRHCGSCQRQCRAGEQCVDGLCTVASYQYAGTFGAAQGLIRPLGVAVDAQDSVFISDGPAHCVRIFAADGAPLGVYGVCGSPGSDPGRFDSPWGLAPGAGGHTFVVDYFNQRVQLFTSAGISIASLGTGVEGSANTQFSFPIGIAIDGADNLYVADTENARVQHFNAATLDYVATLGVTSERGSDNQHFSEPNDVAVDGDGHLFVADGDNHRVQKLASDGAYLATLGSTGSPGAGNTQFNGPVGVAVDADGNIYVSDLGNVRVQKFTRTFAYVCTIGTTGSPGTGNTQFARPRGVAVDSAGNVYVCDSDNGRVQKFAPA